VTVEGHWLTVLLDNATELVVAGVCLNNERQLRIWPYA